MENLARYQAAMVDAIPSHAAILDGTGVILAVNRAWRDHARANSLLTPGWVVGGNYLEACDAAEGPNAESASAVARGLREVLRGERERFVLEYPFHAPDQRRWFRLIASPEGVGPSRAVVVLHMDVTEQKLGEEALRSLAESERQLRAIFELTLDAIFIADDDGRYIDANPAACDLLALALPEIRAHSAADFTLPGSDHQERWAALLRAGRTTGEHEIRLASGLIRQVEFAATADVLPGRHLIVMRDTTERKRAQEALGRSEERFERIFRSSPVGVGLTDLECRFVDANEPMVEFLGYTREEVVGSTTFELDIWADAEQHERVLAELEAGRPVRNLEARFRRKSGEIRDGLVSIHAISVAGGEQAFLAVIADITERKGLEEKLRQAQKMEAVGRLAGGVAHDFNNLLGVITGYADLLGRGLEASDVRLRRVEKIQGAVERAAALVRQLVAFSRKQVLQPRTLDLNEVLAGIQPMLRRVIGEDVELVAVFGKDLLSVRADPGQIEQVVVNLAVNARDAMPQGGRIVLETENVDLDAANPAGAAPGRYVMLSISDTGHGMDAEVRNHLFEPFFTTKPTGQGTGLGLATAYGILQQSGGHIAVASEPGRGSTFKVYLPGVEVAKTSRAAHVEGGLVPGRGETILMVEDEPSLRDMNQEILAECGYRVLAAESGAQALETAASHPGTIHLLLTDVIMPGISGSELARRLGASRPSTKVLYMSGYTGDALVQRGVSEATAALIEKPFTAPTLARRVREILDA